MEIDNKTLHSIASLAKLELADNEVEHYQTDIDNILKLIQQMDSCDTSGTPVMTHPMDATLRLRKDIVTETDQRATLQSSAPAAEKGLYLVPKVID